MATNYLVMKDLIDKADTEFFAAFERFEERLAQLDLEMGSPRAQESAAQVVQTWRLKGQIAKSRFTTTAHPKFASSRLARRKKPCSRK